MILEKKRESINYKVIVKSSKVSADNSIKKADVKRDNGTTTSTVDLTNG